MECCWKIGRDFVLGEADVRVQSGEEACERFITHLRKLNKL
jgi:hypothetical protein